MIGKELSAFGMHLKALHLPEPVTEHRFHPKRKWRFDYAWPDLMVAVEQEGGVWIKGRHTRGLGFIKDMEKYNNAVLLGWRLFRFTPQQIEDGDAALFLEKVLKENGSC